MAVKFEVDMQEALRQLLEFQERSKKAGEALDKLRAQSGKSSGAAGSLMREMHQFYTGLEDKLRELGIDVERTGKQMQSARNLAQNLYTSFAAGNLKATTAAAAYNGQLGEMGRLLRDTATKSSFVKWSQKVALLNQEMAGQNHYLNASLQQLGTAESKRNIQLKARLAAEQRMASAEQRQIQSNKELKQAIELLHSTLGTANAILRERLSIQTREITESARLTGKLGEQRRAYDGLQGGLQAQIAIQQEMNRGLAQSVTQQQREQNVVNELRRALESLNGGMGEQAAQLRILISARQREITESTRAQVKQEELLRTLASLNGGEQEAIVRLEQKVAARRKQIQEEGRAVTLQEELTASAARMLVAEQRVAAAIETRNKVTMEEARAQQQMTRQEAEAIVKLEMLAAANKKYSDALLNEVRAVNGATVAQKELSQARDREREKLERLREQKEFLNSAYGQERAALERAIADQTRYNRLLAMSTAELLGFANAQRRSNQSINMGSQGAAMMRAALNGLQTSIGMYTSGTILAASATYALFRALRSTVTIGSEFTASMAKADAIMSSATSNWMPDSMEGLETQVRALGQATAYTSSEVAQGLVELGQAGLGAGDAILALKPALDLAMIGGVSMAQSADMATNVLATFGMKAGELVDVVDMMALAAANSNTDVTQLANALTYAGPAAHAAGISMKDTTAAIEALSNNGIKASRAGTGLRRLFVSLLNPTKKGAEMLDQYSISVADAEGNTRSLIDILGQLNKALYADGVSEGERLGAIQDLVGVYATSPVASLVAQAGDNGSLERLRRQLDDTSGAAERMREKIENSLKFDWKALTSAFEEAQLHLFDSQEYRMRELTARGTKWLLDLTQPVTEVRNDAGEITEVVSQLDLLISKATLAAEVVGILLAGKIAGKVGGGIANDAKLLAERLTILRGRAADAHAEMRVLQVNTVGATTAMRMQSQAAVSAAGAMTAATGAAARLAAGARIVAGALGWVGLLGSIGYALYEVFNTDHEKDILDQKGRVDELKKSYEDLKAAIDEASRVKEREALRKQIGIDQQKVAAIGERDLVLNRALSLAEQAGGNTTVLRDALAANADEAARLRTQIEGAYAALNRLPEVVTKSSSVTDEELQKWAEYGGLIREQKDAQAAYDAADGRMRLREKDRLDAANAAITVFTNKVRESIQASDEAARNAEVMLGLYNEILGKQTQAMSERLFDKQANTAEKLLRARQEQTKAEADLVKAREGGDARQLDKRGQELLSAKEKVQDLTLELEGQSKKLQENKDSWADLHRTDAEKLANRRQQLAALSTEEQEIARLKRGDTPELAIEREATYLEKKIRLQQEVNQLEQSIQRDKDKGETADERRRKKQEREAEKLKRDAEKNIQQAQSTYDALRQKYDAVGASSAELAKKTAQLDTLQAVGKITTEEKAKALAQLRKEHHELTLEQDKNYQSLQKLREAYAIDSPFAVAISDVAKLNQLLDAGAVSMTEYVRLRQQMREKDDAAVLNGLPTAPTNLGEASSSPFSDLMSIQMERAQGLGAYSERQDDLDMGWQQDVMDASKVFMEKQRALEAEQLQQAEHDARMLELRQERDGKLIAAQERYNRESRILSDRQQDYAEQMSQMVAITMVGSLGNIFGMVADVGEEATSAQKAAFIAQKALAVAQILMYAHVAAARAPAEGGILGIPLGTAILAQGYASAGLVAALAVAEYTGGGKSGGSYSGAYDEGGFIPYNSYGIVGEYGPEIVHGPANVTSRKKSAEQMSGGNPEYHITLAPEIHIESGQGGQAPTANDAKQVAAVVKGVVMSTLAEQIRPNGALDTWLRNRR